MTARTWTIRLPWTGIPAGLSLNARPHWHTLHRVKATTRAVACTLVRAAKVPPLQRCTVELHYHPRDRRRRDSINLALLHKVLVDGAIDAGVCADDDVAHVSTPEPVIHPADPRDPRLLLVITDLGGEAAP